jgi:hypothetical protein
VLLPHLEALPQHEGDEAHEDVGLDAIIALMPDELIFLDTESGFGLRELDISLPELLIAPIGYVRAQQTGALRERCPVVEWDVATTRRRWPAGRTARRSAARNALRARPCATRRQRERCAPPAQIRWFSNESRTFSGTRDSIILEMTWKAARCISLWIG